MVDTVRTLSALQTLLADNTSGDVSQQDLRDFLESSYPHLGTHEGSTDDIVWDGDLAGMTTQTVSGTATWTEARGRVSVVVNGQTADDSASVLSAFTFGTGDEWVVPVYGAMSMAATSGNLSAGIVFSDGTATSSNAVFGHIQLAQTASVTVTELGVGRHGTLTDHSTAPWVSDGYLAPAAGNPVFIKLKYSASNTFQLSFSPDGITYSAFGESDISKTMTPTHVGVAAWQTEAEDGIVTFGPLMKVA